MRDHLSYVRWFEECDLSSISKVGGKNASLGELLKAGIPVPPGFAITTDAYWRFLREGRIEREILDLLKGINAEKVDMVEDVSSKIRATIENTPIGEDLEDYIAEFYRLLSRKCQIPAAPVAVRSSATAEDLPGASFAGQQETYLWIRTVDSVLEHVKKCWSSLFTPRAITYRVKMGFPHEKVAISVGIQKMVKSFTAGVMFTLNPTTGDRSTIVIDANWGFGESVVSGEVTPDHFEVNKVTLEITKKRISSKEYYYGINPERHMVERYEMPTERSNIQCVIDEDVIELAKIGKAIEKHYGKPMDIEWAIEKDMAGRGRIFIVQSRPETVWAEKEVKREARAKPSFLGYVSATLNYAQKTG